MKHLNQLAVMILLASCSETTVHPAKHTTLKQYSIPDLNAPMDDSIWPELRQFRQYPGECYTALAKTHGLQTKPVPDHPISPGCGIFGGVLMSGSSTITISKPMDTSCAMAAGLHLWLRDVVAPAAHLHFGQHVNRLENFGSYACRTRNSLPGERLSEHATANAIDISGFVLDDGRHITVRGIGAAPAADQAFIRAVRKGGCRMFSVVLGPGSDGHHEDHLHFDMGQFRLCK